MVQNESGALVSIWCRLARPTQRLAGDFPSRPASPLVSWPRGRRAVTGRRPRHDMLIGAPRFAQPAAVGSFKALPANSTPFAVRTKQVVGTKLRPSLGRNERCGSP